MENFMQAVYSFFSGYTPQDLIIMATVGVLFLWPGFGVKCMNLLKEKWGLSARTANNAVMGILFVASLLIMIVTGYFMDAPPITLKYVLIVAAFSYTLSQVAYQRIFKKPIDTTRNEPTNTPDEQEGK